ncbi:MAG: hypothetical protein HQ574_07890 [Chloroflexi bacterium]|nr:hypothetical protein [Chloroflexota bacterium]
MSAEPNPKYLANLKIFEDCVALQHTGKPPFIPLSMHFFPAKYAGVSNAAVMNDAELRFKCLKDVLFHYDFPMAPEDGLIWGSWPWNVLQSKQWKKPGDELPDDKPFQFHELEVMRAEDYDAFLDDPSDFALRKILPKITGLFEPLSSLPPLHNFLYYPLYSAPYFSSPDFIKMLEGLREFGEQWAAFNVHFEQYESELTAAGYPMTYGGLGFPPFDVLSVFLRGMRGSLTDMIRRPEQVLAAVDFLTERETSMLIAQAEMLNNPRVAIFAYRGTDKFMSQDQFEKFYWPSLRKMIIALVDSGLTPVPYFEDDYTSRLPYLLDLPKGKVPIHYEKVDRKKAREIVGDHNSFWGDIPASLLALGTPEDVQNNVRELIDIFGDTNGLIIDGAVEIPDEAKPENIEAVFEAIDLYG